MNDELIRNMKRVKANLNSAKYNLNEVKKILADSIRLFVLIQLIQ